MGKILESITIRRTNEVEKSDGRVMITEQAARDFLQSELAEGFQDMNPADLMLALEDRGWQKVGGQAVNDGDSSWIVRRLTVLRARMYWLLDSHAAAAVRTWTNFTLGSGMSFKASNAAEHAILMEFWEDKQNRNVASAESQRRLDRRLLVDGEIFFAIFDTPTGVKIRKIDCTQIPRFITNPDDAEEIWGYMRQYNLPNGDKKTLFYRDWAYQDAPLEDLQISYEPGMNGQKIVPEENVVIYHMSFNAIHQRGNSLLAAALPWLTAMRQFMEDRLAIVSGLSKFIRKLTVKGGNAQVQKVATAMQQAANQGANAPAGVALAERAKQAAKDLFTNEAVQVSDMPRTTGASDSRQDFKNIRLMICAATGMSEPYFGDAESGNLATATAMELPMLKQFESHQQHWSDAWRDIFGIVLNFRDPVRPDVDVNWPPIVKEDVTKYVNAIVAACAEFPELKQPEVLTVVLSVMSVPNVDDVMQKVIAKQEEMAANVAKGLNADGSQPQPVVAPDKPAQQLDGKPSAPAQSAQEAQDGVEMLAKVLAALQASTDAMQEAQA